MKSSLESLRRLYELDSEILRISDECETKPRVVRSHDQELIEKKKQLQQREDDLREAKSGVVQIELDLKSIEEKIDKLKNQLRTIKTNREYSSLQHEIAGFAADKSLTEEKMLAQMGVVETIETDCAALREEVAQKETEHQAEVRRVEAEVAVLRQQLGQLQTRRPEVSGQVPAEAIQEYERILARRGSSAMAPVVDGSCQGCFMRLTLQRHNDLRKGEELITCNSCGRILYLPE